MNHTTFPEKKPIFLLFRVPSRKLNRHILTPMNVGQLQVILNYLLTQIETLNENLVEYLITRDELAIEQVILSFIKEAVRLAYVSNSQYIPWDLDYRRVQFSKSIEGYPSFDIFATCEFSPLRSSDFVREVRDKIGYFQDGLILTIYLSGQPDINTFKRIIA